MAYSIDLKDSDDRINLLINKEIAKILNANISKAVPKIKEELSYLIYALLSNTEVYKAIVLGPLNAHLGFKRGREQNIIEGLIRLISDEVKITFTSFKFNTFYFSGGYNIFMVDSDFKRALQSSLAFTKNKGEKLPWLEWLLMRGDEIIISGYKILLKPTKAGRSKEALMVKGGINSPFWRVPPEYSGVKDLNWITKAFKGNSSSDDAVLSNVQLMMEDIVFSNIAKVI